MLVRSKSEKVFLCLLSGKKSGFHGRCDGRFKRDKCRRWFPVFEIVLHLLSVHVFIDAEAPV